MLSKFISFKKTSLLDIVSPTGFLLFSIFSVKTHLCTGLKKGGSCEVTKL